MRIAIILSCVLLVCMGCEKKLKIEDPHYKELVGTWSTVSDTEKKTVIFTEEGKITILHSAERGSSMFMSEFVYGKNYIVVEGDTLKDYNCFAVRFYKKESVDSAYCNISQKIDNQIVVQPTNQNQRSLFIKIK